jgi:hypothetical protein
MLPRFGYHFFCRLVHRHVADVIAAVEQGWYRYNQGALVSYRTSSLQ